MTIRPAAIRGLGGGGGSGCSELALPVSEELESEDEADELEDWGDSWSGRTDREKLKLGPLPKGRILDL